VANVVMIGYVAAALGIIPHDVLVDTVLRNVPKETEDLNRKAVDAGRELFEQSV